MRRLLPLFIAILGGLFLVAVRIFAQGGTTIYLPMVARADIVTATVVYTPTWWATSGSSALDHETAYNGTNGADVSLLPGYFGLANYCTYNGCLIQRTVSELRPASNVNGEVISASIVVSLTYGYNHAVILREPFNVHLGTWKDQNPGWHDFDPNPIGRWIPTTEEDMDDLALWERVRIPLNAFVGAPPPPVVRLLFRFDDQKDPGNYVFGGIVWHRNKWQKEDLPRLELVVRVSVKP